jgi:2-phospho-L-lactate guanylyltransferase
VDEGVGADLSRIWAIVPIRGLESAKTRLGDDLDPEERLVLVTEMLRRTLVATRDAQRIVGTVVVTMDPAAAAIANRHRAIGLVERVPGGLNEAIRAARSVAIARDASAVLVLPADLPAVTATVLDDIVEAAATAMAARSGIVALVPDRHGAGTNALLVSPPALVEPAFGVNSRSVHAAGTRAAGARYLEVDGPLALDIDTADDLLVAAAALAGRHG